MGLKSLAVGGYTGSGIGVKDSTGQVVAGVVHANEYVLNANMVKSNPDLIATLEAMRTGKKGYAEGGLVGRISDIISGKSDSRKILDYNTWGKTISDFSNITKAMKSLGFYPSKTQGDSKTGFSKIYSFSG